MRSPLQMRLAARVSFAALTALAAMAMPGISTPAMAQGWLDFSDTPVAQWQGFYAGAALGWGADTDNVSIPGASDSLDMTGGTISIFAGHDWQTGPYVLGLESAIGIHEIKGTAPAGSLSALTDDNLLSAQFRARAGYAIGRFLPYVTAGLAYGSSHLHRTANMAW